MKTATHTNGIGGEPVDNIAKTYFLTPISKPRMSRRDKWTRQVRPAVAEYRSYCDECRRLGIDLPPAGAHVLFIIPMPPSWSKKKKAAHLGGPHQSTPDLDNLIKALGDALYHNDSGIWDIRATKIWGTEGKIVITINREADRLRTDKGGNPAPPFRLKQAGPGEQGGPDV